MSSKAQRLRNKKRFQDAAPAQGPGKKALNLKQAQKRQDNKPTPERQAQGSWVKGKAEQPDVDMASDMIGRLHQARDLSAAQVEAARAFQELRAAYVQELDCQGYRSCLAGGVGGYDSGDGNPEVTKAYDAMVQRIGKVNAKVLTLETDKLPEDRPRNLWVLKRALDVMAS